MLDIIVLLAEIGIVISGLLTLRTGTFRVSPTKTTQGWQVRLGALIGILPILIVAIVAP